MSDGILVVGNIKFQHSRCQCLTSGTRSHRTQSVPGILSHKRPSSTLKKFPDDSTISRRMSSLPGERRELQEILDPVLSPKLKLLHVY